MSSQPSNAFEKIEVNMSIQTSNAFEKIENYIAFCRLRNVEVSRHLAALLNSQEHSQIVRELLCKYIIEDQTLWQVFDRIKELALSTGLVRGFTCTDEAMLLLDLTALMEEDDFNLTEGIDTVH